MESVSWGARWLVHAPLTIRSFMLQIYPAILAIFRFHTHTETYKVIVIGKRISAKVVLRYEERANERLAFEWDSFDPLV